MKFEFFQKSSLGGQIEVVQTFPDKGDVFPTVIFVPGFGVDLHEGGYFDEISNRFVRNGMQTIRFSFTGTGKSEGDFLQTTIDTQAIQLQEIIEMVMKDRFTDTSRIAILAQGFGCAVTMTIMPLPQIKTFLFLAPSAHPEESLSKWFKRQRGFNPQGVSTRESIKNNQISIDTQFWASLRRHNLIGKIKLLESPIAFIHGTKDQKVKALESNQLYAAVTSKKKFHIIKHGDHTFTGQYRLPVLDLMTDWLEETL